jgi:ubiquinone/menaquinone biosynthesis C-methylase UbiE
VTDWRSYDEISETYERVHSPRFAKPAADLVALASPPAGGRVLDVGTGTGVAAAAALAATGAEGKAIGADISTGMVATGARFRSEVEFVAASGIDLPFAEATFDVVTANFVLSHFPSYETGLFEMTRVLKHGGRLAVSSWTDAEDELQATWGELIQEVVPREILEPVWAEAAPWHERFRDRDLLEKALMGSGLSHIRSEPVEYRFVIPLSDYIAGLAVWPTGRFVRSVLDEDEWNRLLERTRAVYLERFADPVNDFQSALLAVGTKP